MATVALRGLEKAFIDPQTQTKVLAVNNLNLEIRDGEFLVLVGPSGCGKSTALRMIAGLETSTGGEILIGDRVVNNVAPSDRNIAMVFQNYALYPHLTVYENMALALKLRRLAGFVGRLTNRAQVKKITAEIDAEIRAAAEVLGITHLLERKPKALSGGQRQRVALGRAIVREPQVFLMDEPLSNLDAKLRVQTRAELIKLHRRLGVTTIYVTHDQVEAMTMGQRIAVMKDGVLQQCAEPLELYYNPVNTFVAGFIGTPSMNFMPATLETNGGSIMVDADSLQIELPSERTYGMMDHVGKDVVLGIRPEDIYDAQHIPNSVHNVSDTLKMKVEVVEPMGSSSIVYLRRGKHSLLAELSSASDAREGHDIEVVLNLDAVHLFDAASEMAIGTSNRHASAVVA